MAVDFPASVIRRFWSKVAKTDDPDACWLWLGGVDKDGYGVFGLSSKVKTVRANRFAYEIVHGLLGDLQALHSCDNPPCCNPRHLHAGTHDQNHAEKAARGRSPVPWLKKHPELALRGEAHPNTKVTDAQVDEIRRCYVPRRTPLVFFARKFGTSVSNVYAIVKKLSRIST